MKLTTKGRYAVTAMLDIALHQEQGPVSLLAISQRQKISQRYLEQLSAKLRRAGLLASVRGPSGGYYLQLSASDISISDIIIATKESIDSTQCGGAENCHDGMPCLTHQLWADLTETIDQFLQQITLQDVISKPQVQQVAQRQNQCLIANKQEFITKTSVIKEGYLS